MKYLWRFIKAYYRAKKYSWRRWYRLSTDDAYDADIAIRTGLRPFEFIERAKTMDHWVAIARAKAKQGSDPYYCWLENSGRTEAVRAYYQKSAKERGL